MPHTTKLIVTTKQNSTLGQFVKSYPYWIGYNYSYCGDAVDPDHDKWDIAVMSDGAPPASNLNGLDCKLDLLVIWLMHQSAEEDHRKKQEKWITAKFPKCKLEIIPFSRGHDNDLLYFNTILALCQQHSCDADVYRKLLAQLHRRLFGRDLTEHAVAYLYSLALAMEFKRLNSGQPETSAERKAIEAVDNTRASLYQALYRQGSEGANSMDTIDEYSKGLDSALNVNVDQFRTIRDALRQVCNA